VRAPPAPDAVTTTDLHGCRVVPVGAGTDVALGFHGRRAQGADRPAGGDDAFDLAAEDARLAARQKAAKVRRVALHRFDVEGLDREQILALQVAEADLAGAEIDVEDRAEGRWLHVRFADRPFPVETLAGLGEPDADARQLLLLHPHGGGFVSGPHKQAEASLTRPADCLRVYRYYSAEVVSRRLHGAQL
jgi:hypothetical protein